MPAKKKPANPARSLTFNHAMIYVQDVERALHFYQDLLAFKLIDDFRNQGHLVYARLRAPAGRTTIALHKTEPGGNLASNGVRLYFEVKELGRLCKQLLAQGVEIPKMPQQMPWGWKHAYLNDPDGHEVSLYWAGAKRFQKDRMKA